MRELNERMIRSKRSTIKAGDHSMKRSMDDSVLIAVLMGGPGSEREVSPVSYTHLTLPTTPYV